MASSSSSFQLLMCDALDAYKGHTGKDLLAHPLANQLQTWDSPGDILLLLHQQIQALSQSRKNTHQRLTRFLDPTVNVLYIFSMVLGEGFNNVFSPGKAIFTGIGILLQAVRDTRASQGRIIEIFERLEFFFRRLETYTEVPPSPEMEEIIIKIIVEFLTILALATKDINQCRMKKYMKNLIGTADIENALRRLDNLTQEEARMALSQVLRAARKIDDRVAGVDERISSIDERIAGVDERVTSVDEGVTSVGETVTSINHKVANIDDSMAGIDGRLAVVDETVRAIDDRMGEVIDDGNEARALAMQQSAEEVDRASWNQVRESCRVWLSPPDPSINHNMACAAHLKGTATWFLKGSTFQKWKSSNSLLWIHGKPGSGKSVLCSTIIQDIGVMHDAGQASMAYFYFDFRDTGKQYGRDLVSSLLCQLSAGSGPRCDILSRLLAAHDDGASQPSDEALTNCLKEMLKLPDQCPSYLIIDGLNESADASGIPSPREHVLQLVEDLVELRLPDLHICVTSRPHSDIKDVFEPLTPLRVSLHDESGQRGDILTYVKSVVYSNSERIMRRWRKEEKDLVVATLSSRADGMFRWTVCQLEILRNCLPSSVRRTLEELPESLDETYERILMEIKTPHRINAHRLMQCLVAAIRPLRMEELAEVLAIDFDDKGGVPKYNPRWRWEDQEQALLSSCSSLIIIVNVGGSRVVQFSHSSVKEYLTSPRLATRENDVSRYHILLEPAHAILAQACVSVLLRSEDHVVQDDIENDSPLAQYAARHWASHAKFENVSSRIKGMEYLFDRDEPYFDSWRRLYDIDTRPDASCVFHMFVSFDEPEAGPLYYAALCGFHDVTKHIIEDYPQDVNARGGYYVTPLVAALAGRHFETAQILRNHDADPNVLCYDERTPLHAAVQSGHLEMIQKLVEHSADINARNVAGWTPLHIASQLNRPNIEVIRFLLLHGINVNAQAKDGSTALHAASAYGTLEVVSLLLRHGARVETKDNKNRTARQIVSGTDKGKKLKLLKQFSAPGGTAFNRPSANRHYDHSSQPPVFLRRYMMHRVTCASSSALSRRKYSYLADNSLTNSLTSTRT